MIWRPSRLCVLLLYILGTRASSLKEEFFEEVTIRPLRDGRVASTFTFTSLLHGAAPRSPERLIDEDEPQHYTLFPLGLGQILREYAVTELHLSLNSGKWDYERWGYPDESGVATGAELWAWMADGAPNVTIDERWRGLRNALAGLFCASLGHLDEKRTTSPIRAFLPEGSLPNSSAPYELRHATLPSEHVCTENLTPFLKLLPCKSLSGVAHLLNPHRLFDADWHGMGIHVFWREGKGVEVKLGFQLVSDPVRLSSDQKRDWSFMSLFDRVIDKRCPVASSSRIHVSKPADGIYVFAPMPSVPDDDALIFDVAAAQLPLDVALRWPDENRFRYPLTGPEMPLTALSVQRILKGSGQSHGQLSVVVQNNVATEMEVIYLETMPWLLELYLHTLQITVDGQPRDDLISQISYIPSSHSRPTLFESLLKLPPKVTLRLTFDVTKTFLRYTEHPPDAQRGWDLPPAVFVPLLDGNQSQKEQTRRIFTPALLVDLATPDFSMPYNVIIMSCTLIALICMSVFNMLMRRFVVIPIRQ